MRVPGSKPSAPAREVEAARKRLETGRNQPCPCGSGRKYKKCCLASDEAQVREATSESDADGRAGGESDWLDDQTAAEPSVSSRFAPEGPAEALWQEVEAAESPPVEQMDERAKSAAAETGTPRGTRPRGRRCCGR